ncbi:ATP-binding protein [Brevibacillus panacihumi]|uniref:ATP-binding protein n=1 Tax=Brevibacillus panacihumi TaxID=497735 RepID=UPI003D19B9C6
MRIEEVQLKGFGKYQDAVFRFAPGINLFFAPNEAGKSTLLHGMIAALYGMKRDYVKTTRYLPEYEKYRPWQPGPYETIITYQLAGRTYRLHRSLLKEREEARLFLDPEWTELTDVYQEDRRKERNFIEKHLGLSRSLFTDVTWIRREPLAAGEHLMPALMTDTQETSPIANKILADLERDLSAIGKKEKAENTLLGKATALLSQKEAELRQAEAVSQEMSQLSRQLADWESERVSLEQLRHRLLQKKAYWAKREEEWQKRWQLSHSVPDEEQWRWWEETSFSQEERVLHQQTHAALHRLQIEEESEHEPMAPSQDQEMLRRLQTDYEQGVALRRQWEDAHVRLAQLAASTRRSESREPHQGLGWVAWLWTGAVASAGIGVISWLFERSSSSAAAFALTAVLAAVAWFFGRKRKGRNLVDSLPSAEMMRIQEELAFLDDRLGALLSQWQMPDWEAFVEYREQRQKQFQERESRHTAERISRQEEANKLIREWGTAVRECLTREKQAWGLQDWQRECARAEEQLQEVRERIAKATGQMEAHEGISVAQSRAEYEEAQAGLARLLEKREALQLARDALVEAMAEWNRDVSPGVNRQASLVMEKISEGRYREVRLDPRDSFSVKVLEPHNQRVLEQEHCSTGTQDQLYFAQRMALFHHVSQQTEPLPLFLDDHFVHYDQRRLERALAYLEEVSEEHQIFLFSCTDRELLVWERMLSASQRHRVHAFAEIRA